MHDSAVFVMTKVIQTFSDSNLSIIQKTFRKSSKLELSVLGEVVKSEMQPVTHLRSHLSQI